MMSQHFKRKSEKKYSKIHADNAKSKIIGVYNAKSKIVGVYLNKPALKPGNYSFE